MNGTNWLTDLAGLTHVGSDARKDKDSGMPSHSKDLGSPGCGKFPGLSVQAPSPHALQSGTLGSDPTGHPEVKPRPSLGSSLSLGGGDQITCKSREPMTESEQGSDFPIKAGRGYPGTPGLRVWRS